MRIRTHTPHPQFSKLLWVSLTLATLWGCGGGSTSGTWVAEVNGDRITLDQFEKALNSTTHLPGRDFSTASKKTEFLNEMIREKLLFQAAEKDDFLAKSPDLQRALAKAYLQAYMEKNFAAPREEDLKAFFAKHRQEMESVRAAHILIKPAKAKDEKSLAEARQKAEKLLAELQADNTDEHFHRLAARYSGDLANAQSGGELGWFPFGRMVPPFSQAAFALAKPGDLSGVVETRFGFHLIRLLDAKRGFDTFRPMILERFTRDGQRALAEKFLKELEDRASLRLDTEAIKQAQVRQKSLQP